VSRTEAGRVFQTRGDRDMIVMLCKMRAKRTTATTLDWTGLKAQ